MLKKKYVGQNGIKRDSFINCVTNNVQQTEIKGTAQMT